MKMERTKTDTLGVHHCTMVLPVFVLYLAFLQQSIKTVHSQQGLTDFPTYNSIWLDLLVFRYNRTCPACCVSAGNVSKHSVCIIDMQMCCVDSLVWCQTFRMAQLQFASQLYLFFNFNPHFDTIYCMCLSRKSSSAYHIRLDRFCSSWFICLTIVCVFVCAHLYMSIWFPTFGWAWAPQPSDASDITVGSCRQCIEYKTDRLHNPLQEIYEKYQLEPRR